MTIRAVTCPSCHNTYLVRGGGRLHCSPCTDTASSVTDTEAGEIRHYNTRGQLVGREAIKTVTAKATYRRTPAEIAMTEYTVTLAESGRTHRRRPV